MHKYIIVVLCTLAFMLSCGPHKGKENRNDGYPSEPYNLMNLFELPDVQYVYEKSRLVNFRGFEEGQKWAKRVKSSSGKSQVKTRAIELFTKHYGRPEEMTNDMMNKDIYEDLRDDYVTSFSEGCSRVWFGQ